MAGALVSNPAGGADISAALREFLDCDTAGGGDVAGEDDGLVGDLALGELDISTRGVSSLAGLEAQLDHFSEHPVLKAILDQVLPSCQIPGLRPVPWRCVPCPS